MVGTSTNDAYFDSVFWIPASKTIENIQAVPGIQIINCAFAIYHERIFWHLCVDRTPLFPMNYCILHYKTFFFCLIKKNNYPDIFCCRRFIYNTFIFRTSSFFSSWISCNGPWSGNRRSIFMRNGLFIQDRDGRYSYRLETFFYKSFYKKKAVLFFPV